MSVLREGAAEAANANGAVRAAGAVPASGQQATEASAASAEQQLYVLGHPVGHSKSPAMYNAAYGQLGLPWHYGLMDCPTADEAERFLAARQFLSINVTTPYKPLAAAEADALAPEAQLARGANLLVREGATLVAHNVDGAGCVGYLLREGVAFGGALVAVCGTGPTALAIMHACLLEGAARVTLLGRDAARSQQVLAGYLATAEGVMQAAKAPVADRLRAAYGQTLLEASAYGQAAAALAEADIVIDATPLGMAPGDPAPFDTALLRPGQTVFDVVYGHGTTALVAAARQAGARAFDGRGMLVAQAVATLRLVCAAAQVECAASFDELFATMAEAAGFGLA